MCQCGQKCTETSSRLGFGVQRPWYCRRSDILAGAEQRGQFLPAMDEQRGRSQAFSDQPAVASIVLHRQQHVWVYSLFWPSHMLLYTSLGLASSSP